MKLLIHLKKKKKDYIPLPLPSDSLKFDANQPLKSQAKLQQTTLLCFELLSFKENKA